MYRYFTIFSIFILHLCVASRGQHTPANAALIHHSTHSTLSWYNRETRTVLTKYQFIFFFYYFLVSLHMLTEHILLKTGIKSQTVLLGKELVSWSPAASDRRWEHLSAEHLWWSVYSTGPQERVVFHLDISILEWKHSKALSVLAFIVSSRKILLSRRWCHGLINNGTVFGSDTQVAYTTDGHKNVKVWSLFRLRIRWD